MPSFTVVEAPRAPVSKLDPIDVPFLTIAAVQRLTGLKKARLYQLIQAGQFPKQFPLPSGGVRWDRDQVEGWMTSGRPPCHRTSRQAISTFSNERGSPRTSYEREVSEAVASGEQA